MIQGFPWDDFIRLIKSPEIIAVFITAGLEIIRRLLQPKASIVWGTSHGTTFSIPQNQGANLLISTGSIFIRNSGRKAAKNVEFCFNYKPEHFHIWPALNYSTELGPNNTYIIKMDFITKAESFYIEVIQSHVAPPALLSVRAEEGKCRNVNMTATQINPRWFNLLAVTILALGVYQLVVLLIKLVS